MPPFATNDLELNHNNYEDADACACTHTHTHTHTQPLYSKMSRPDCQPTTSQLLTCLGGGIFWNSGSSGVGVPVLLLGPRPPTTRYRCRHFTHSTNRVWAVDMDRHRETHTITTAAQLHWSCSSLRLGAWPVKGDPHLGHTIWPSPPAPPLVLRPVPPRHVSWVLPWRRAVVPTGELTLHQTQPEMG